MVSTLIIIIKFKGVLEMKNVLLVISLILASISFVSAQEWVSIPEESIEISGGSERIVLISPLTEQRAYELERIGHSRSISPIFHSHPKKVAVRCGAKKIEIFITSPEVRRRVLSSENERALRVFLNQCTYEVFDQAAEKIRAAVQ